MDVSTSRTNGRIGLGWVGLALSGLWAAALSVIAWRGNDTTSTLPLALILFSQAGVAAVGRLRPPALFCAALLGLPLAMVSFAGLGFPFLIPTILFFVALGRTEGPSAMGVTVSVLTIAAMFAAFVVMASFGEMRCHPIPGGESCGEEPTRQAALASAAISVVAIAGGGSLLARRA